jgi:hypothetical protein
VLSSLADKGKSAELAHANSDGAMASRPAETIG